MSMYGDSNEDKNYLFEEIKDFLDDHKVSELIKIVEDAIRYKEEGY